MPNQVDIQFRIQSSIKNIRRLLEEIRLSYNNQFYKAYAESKINPSAPMEYYMMCDAKCKAIHIDLKDLSSTVIFLENDNRKKILDTIEYCDKRIAYSRSQLKKAINPNSSLENASKAIDEIIELLK